MDQDNQVVKTEKPKPSDLWKKEDYWAIWLAFLLLLIGCALYLPRNVSTYKSLIYKQDSVMNRESAVSPLKTIEWHQANDTKLNLKANTNKTGKLIANLTATPKKWISDPIEAFYLSPQSASERKESALAKYETFVQEEKQMLEEAVSAQAVAKQFNFENEQQNKAAQYAIEKWRNLHVKAADAKKKADVKPYNILPYQLIFMLLLAIFFGIGMYVMNKQFIGFTIAFIFVFLLALVSYLAASQATMKDLGFGTAAWAIIFGLIISNTIGTPAWIKPALQTEFYIKTGLVLLGAEILLGKIMAIGLPGIFVAWVVTPIVLVLTYIFGQKVLKVSSKTLNITISADMSVCGVSAAIATAAACRAKKEELTLAIGLSLIFTSIMMIVMPALIKAAGMPEILGGAWIGGTIDATGAVIAAGAFLGPKALSVAATIKMIQNMLIGVIAFGVAVYWSVKVDRTQKTVSAMEIWYRFPKFIIGFLLASIVFSILFSVLGNDLGYSLIDHGVIRGFSEYFREWFFTLAFVSIGLATNFKELKSHFKGGKPLLLYVCGQLFNLLLTLLMAYFMFYVIFTEITNSI